MKLLSTFLLIPALAVAAPRASTNYTLAPEGFVSGVPHATSTNYTLDGASSTSNSPRFFRAAETTARIATP